MKHNLLIAFALSASLAAPARLRAEVKLPAIISDHMLLQQQSPVRIWGWADPGEAVTVSFAGQKVGGTAGQDGKWGLFLKPLKLGVSGAMTIAGKNTIKVEDVLVGDVWVGSGQSNMGFTVGRSDNAEKEIAAAKYPNIRLFAVKLQVADQPAEDTTGKWVLCSPDTIKNFSAVLYYFGREVHLKRKIPVGLINTSWGGTPAQSWTTRGTLESDASLKWILDDWATTLERYPAAKQKYDEQVEAWKKAAAEAKAAGRTPPTAPRPPSGPGHQNTPGGLYNAMIAPIVPYAIKGAVWYQGEANASQAHAVAYRKLFRAMIEDWRREWGIGPFPFGFVQLANFKSSGWWPLLRESQNETLNVRHTGQAVTIDIGNPTDIHPTNKQDVGKRLGLWARATVYGERVEYSGPVYRTAAVEGGKMRLWFDHIGLGLAARGGGKLEGFIVAGKDGSFVPAEAKIEGETVVVSSGEVAEPAAVRYGWEDSPACNFINKAGLPASPFRTDVKSPK
jgi:sialate O-acetylesterase